MRRIQPSSVGLGTWPELKAMLFWPGWMVSGPNSKCIRSVPAGPVGAAVVLVVDGWAPVVGAGATVVGGGGVISAAGVVSEPLLLHAAVTRAATAATASHPRPRIMP